MLVFESIEDDLQAWLAIKDDDKVVFCEFPADYDGSNGWNLEDGGILRKECFSVLYTLKNDRGTVVYLIWYDIEGNVVYKIAFSPEKPID